MLNLYHKINCVHTNYENLDIWTQLSLMNVSHSLAVHSLIKTITVEL